jgi:hypothetical protein
MRILFFILAFLCVKAVSGQGNHFVASDRHFSINTLAPLVFTYTSAHELLERKVLPNAFEVKVKAKNSYNIYANIQAATPSVGEFMNNLFLLRLVSMTSQTATVAATEIELSEQPKMLFMQPAKMQGMEDVSFLYDVILKPVTTFVKPGSYSFSIIFTITPQ